jgi:hypothetical protein
MYMYTNIRLEFIIDNYKSFGTYIDLSISANNSLLSINIYDFKSFAIHRVLF